MGKQAAQGSFVPEDLAEAPADPSEEGTGKRRGMSAELRAMATVERVLSDEDLDDDARRRVLAWAWDRWMQPAKLLRDAGGLCGGRPPDPPGACKGVGFGPAQLLAADLIRVGPKPGESLGNGERKAD